MREVMAVARPPNQLNVDLSDNNPSAIQQLIHQAALLTKKIGA
jgi:hypothetical protein